MLYIKKDLPFITPQYLHDQIAFASVWLTFCYYLYFNLIVLTYLLWKVVTYLYSIYHYSEKEPLRNGDNVPDAKTEDVTVLMGWDAVMSLNVADTAPFPCLICKPPTNFTCLLTFVILPICLFCMFDKFYVVHICLCSHLPHVHYIPGFLICLPYHTIPAWPPGLHFNVR